MAEHPRKKTPPTIGVTSTETSQVSSHKATAVWPVCDPMPKARTGSKPSKRMTPMKSPLWICDSFRMGWSPGGETRFLCAKTKMLLEEALKGARAGNQSESVGFRALWLFLCIIYILYIYIYNQYVKEFQHHTGPAASSQCPCTFPRSPHSAGLPMVQHLSQAKVNCLTKLFRLW